MFYRGRRLRRNSTIRSMLQETKLYKSDLILPIFVCEGENIFQEITSLKGHYHYSIDNLYKIVDQMKKAGILSCILFGIVEHKDACGSEAYNDNGIIQQAIRKIKELNNDIYVIADVCMCEYTDHGHCGILDDDGNVNNDETLKYLSKIALSYAKAGVDMVAPSDMMDGHILALRNILDENGFTNLPIMGYSAKFASAYYGPFREAAHSTPSFGDRQSYQMDYHNGQEALREVEADINEGADIIMVKPAMAYLDIIKEVNLNYNMPLCAYQVSGEYAMLVSAVDQGLMNESVIMESLIAIKRAGAQLIITYFALDVAKELNS
ncbi:MAG: porphobilinogen synthase [Erysipelotrichaceae bacterium]|nr:porphobilinogen synthase [Erysipelotrichaceae bacterium]